MAMAFDNSQQDELEGFMKLVVYEDEQNNLDNRPSDPSWNT